MNSKKIEISSRLHYFLSGILYPISKKNLIKYARNKGADTGSLDTLEKLSEEEYRSESGVLNDIELSKNNPSHENRVPPAMRISKNLPQFEEKSGLLIVTGKQEAILYYAYKGVVSCIDLFKIPKPRYSDREGYYKVRAKDGAVRSGSAKESQDENLERDFISLFRRHIKKVVDSKLYTEVFLFIPSYLKSAIFNNLPAAASKRITDYIPGNYFKFKPLDLIKKIVVHRLPQVKVVPEEARKILRQFDQARFYGKGR